jgi:hypothetical protein
MVVRDLLVLRDRLERMELTEPLALLVPKGPLAQRVLLVLLEISLVLMLITTTRHFLMSRKLSQQLA